MVDRFDRLGRIGILVLSLLAAGALGWALFVWTPDGTADLLGIVLLVVLVLLGVRIGNQIASKLFPAYNVAEVAVEGPITRDGGTPLPVRPGGTPADAIVDQIERADADRGADALLVKLNTPGGEVVPADAIRRAAVEFDGPTIAYATDVCASGGYWIASGCDELWAHEASIVGSIGVIGSRINAVDFAEKVGVSYERFAAGKYKDAGLPLKEMTEDEREYLQGLIDEFYENFVDRVAEGRELPAEAVRDTEAKVFLGEAAAERDLVDQLGVRADIEDELGEKLGEPVVVESFEPELGLRERLSMGAQRLAYALGAGLASSVTTDGEFSLRL